MTNFTVFLASSLYQSLDKHTYRGCRERGVEIMKVYCHHYNPEFDVAKGLNDGIFINS